MFENAYDEEDSSGRGCNEVCGANETSGLQGGVINVKIMHGHAIQERHSVLTNQCLGKETNAEPLGRGTGESFLMDSDKFIVVGNDITDHACIRIREEQR
jgi:hypothetical protein